jgi:hypothetical protein
MRTYVCKGIIKDDKKVLHQNMCGQQCVVVSRNQDNAYQKGPETP